MKEIISNIYMEINDEKNVGILFITTHGAIELDKNGAVPKTRVPLNIVKLDGVKPGLCNAYQRGMPNIIPNIIKTLRLNEKLPGFVVAELVKRMFIMFERGGPETRDGRYMFKAITDWMNEDKDYKDFYLLRDTRFSIKSFTESDEIINKIYEVNKDEVKKGAKYENRIILYVNGKPIELFGTWRRDGIDSNAVKKAQLRTGETLTITLKQIFELIKKTNIELDELVIIDLTCSVILDKEGKKLDAQSREARYIRYTARLGKNKKSIKKKKKGGTKKRFIRLKK